MDPRRGEFAASGGAGLQPSQSSGATRRSLGGGGQAGRDPGGAGLQAGLDPAARFRPVLPPDIPQFFAPAPGVPAYAPMIVGAASVRFAGAKEGIDETRDVVFVTPVSDAAVAVDWTNATEADFALEDLSKEPADGATFEDVPPAAQKAKNYADWTKGFTSWLTREQSLDLFRSPSVGVVSKPGESERDFRVRLQQAAREKRDAQVAALRQKYAPKMQALEERLRKVQQAVAREQEQVTSSRMQVGISLATTVFGAMFGRKALSASTLGRATTAARGMGRTMKESQDVARATENAAAVQAQIQELESSLQADVAAADSATASASETFETISLKPRRTDVQVKLVALVWVG